MSQGSQKPEEDRTEKNFVLAEPVYEVDARTPETDELGLIPPPSFLLAPWAKRPEPAVEQEAIVPVPVVEQKAAQKTSEQAVQPAAFPEKYQGSAFSPRVAAPHGQTAIGRPQTARPQTARPLAQKSAER